MYRSLSLTVSEADDETMASKRGALEVEKLLLEASLDDKNSRRRRAPLLDAAPGGYAAVGGGPPCRRGTGGVQQQPHRCGEAGRETGSRGQSRNEAKRHAPTLIVPHATDQTPLPPLFASNR